MNHSRASLERLPALDGLRGVCIILVCYSHLAQLLHARHLPGTYGVTIFFFISGFIITRLLLHENSDTGRVALVPFYIRRWFRLTPALIAYVLLSLTVLAALGRSVPTADVCAVLLYYANYHEIMAPFATFASANAAGIQSPFAVAWSLAVEEHFYLLFPLLLLSLRRHTAALAWVLSGFVVFILAWRIHLACFVGESSLVPLRIYEGTDTRLDSIAYGCLLSVLMHRAAHGARFESAVLHALRGYRGVFVAAALFVISMAPRAPEFKDTAMYSLEGLGLMALFASLFGMQPVHWLKASLENRGLVFLGTISYSVYLYHYLAFVAAQLLLTNRVAEVSFAAVVGLAAALGSYHWVEVPVRRLGAELLRTKLEAARRRAVRVPLLPA